MSNRLTTEEFIKRSKLKHGDKYDYSQVEYVHAHKLVTITCVKHGNFNQKPGQHIYGMGCSECGKEKRIEKSRERVKINKFKGISQPQDYKIIPLTHGKFAKVDNEDFEKLNAYIWSLSRGRSSDYGFNTKLGVMHRVIMEAPSNMVVDHINHDTLDNRKHNLRICTSRENGMNQLPQQGRTSIYKGVSWHKISNIWRAYITSNSKHIHIGHFADEKEAAKAYDKKAKELFGEFAFTNF